MSKLRTSLAGCTLLALFTSALAEAGQPKAESPKSAPITAQQTAKQAEFFEAQVRPLLAAKCFSCHGDRKQSGGLRLDSRAHLLEGSDLGSVVVPGDPDKSKLIQAVRHQGNLKMPPREKLKDEAIQTLTLWVKMGLPWPASPTRVQKETRDDPQKHWAFQPVREPAVPQTRLEGWAKSPLDRFILARLEAKGLKPSAPASRRTLIRRATFDLIGLPPTPAEVAAFEADTSDDAFAKVIDRLLASPHYGERWGRHWLDVARYADTKGYVFLQDDKYPWAYTYRDYVIRAFNEDLPYDRFIIEQLAADILPLEKDKRALTALGFLTVGARFMNNRQNILDDYIDVTTRGLLGLTVTCARCHDHKYDPIPAADYYSLYGVFASTHEPPVPPLFQEPPQTAEYLAYERELKKREKQLTDFVQSKHKELVDGARTRVADYLLAAHAIRDQPSQRDFMLLADTNDLNPTMIRRYHAYLRRNRGKNPVWAPWHAFADLKKDAFAQQAAGVLKKLAATPGLNPRVLKALGTSTPGSMKAVAEAYGKVLNEAHQLWLDAKAKKADRLADASAEQLRQVFHGVDAPPNVPVPPLGDLDLLPDRPSQATLKKLLGSLDSWRASGKGAPPRAMVLLENEDPYSPYVFLRGNPGQRGKNVPRQFVSILAGEDRKPFTNGSGRLELARAIAHPDNPLTARVFVNRVWMYHFGQAIVRTPSDFGVRSDPPTHPQLLDYLASTFVKEGWSIKKLHRTIMLSAAYQQQSLDRPEARKIDPENMLLWRMNRQRLDFEALRDALLAVSGKLNPALGGPPVRDITATSANRRTLYGYIDRFRMPGLYRTFDFPSPDTTSPQRSKTTVPQQALFLMNDPFVESCARKLLERPEVAGKTSTDERVALLYNLLYGRQARPDEVSLAHDFLGTTPNINTWRTYTQALLLANEFAFVD